jgi:diadenosine tetraphosphate (Ap4A) HIT family hydrolase
MLAGMSVHPKWLFLLGALSAARMALAEPPATKKQPPRADSAATDAAARTAGDRKTLMRQLRNEREQMVRERGEIFSRIATKHDYSGEYVLFRDQEVTAFLDLKDPRHPRYSPEHDDEAPTGGSKGVSHILVVPNQPRETIGKTLASDITAEDLELTLKVMRAAAGLARRLGIKNPKIYVKSPERVGVGYLHVHVLGERDPNLPYPPPLK